MNPNTAVPGRSIFGRASSREAAGWREYREGSACAVTPGFAGVTGESADESPHRPPTAGHRRTGNVCAQTLTLQTSTNTTLGLYLPLTTYSWTPGVAPEGQVRSSSTSRFRPPHWLTETYMQLSDRSLQCRETREPRMPPLRIARYCGTSCADDSRCVFDGYLVYLFSTLSAPLLDPTFAWQRCHLRIRPVRCVLGYAQR